MQSYNLWYDTTSVWQSVSGGWTNDAYRQITLAQPATGDLLTWLEANAVRLPLTGTWVFNSSPAMIGASSSVGIDNINFISNNYSFNRFYIDNDIEVINFQNTNNNEHDVSVYTGKTDKWTDQAYRTITFTKPVKYEGNEEFIKWFTANAKPLPAKGKTLNEYTWDEISRISLADKAAEYGFKVGDAKQVHLSGTAGGATFDNDYWVYIIGINHNEAKEGKGIAFQGFKTAQTGGIDVALAGANYGPTSTTGFVMNQTNTNSGGWNGSYAYKTVMSQIKAILPTDLQAVIRTTNLYTDNTGIQSTSASAVTSNSNEVYYLAEYEVFGTNKYANTNESAQQAQYAYYKAGNSRMKYRSDDTGTAALWRLRSPLRSSSYTFCTVYTSGSVGDSNAYFSYGSAPCFKV